jgi:hypothetical protein
MKLFISIVVAAFALASESFATGVVQPNAPQSGVVNFTGTNQGQTISFQPPFSVVPVMTLFGGLTNASPITNSVTATNFTISVASTNLSVAWTAYQGYPRIQFGTNAASAATLITNTFPVPFAFVPIVNIQQTATNAVAGSEPVVSTITSTNFVIKFTDSTGTNQVIYWGALGQAFAPGAQNVTY